MRVGLLAALAYLTAFCRAETYTLLHRSTGHSVKDASWKTRALVKLGDEAAPVYESVAEWSELPSDNAAYQLMLVPGDVREQSSSRHRAFERTSPIAYSPECQLYTGNSRRDNIGIYMSAGHPVSISFAVSHDAPLDVDGCPHKSLPSSVDTTIQTFGPVIPEEPIRKPPAVHTEKGPDGAPQQKPEKSLLQRYWYYIIPIVILIMLPGAEDVPDPMRPPNTGARQVAQGSGVRKA